MNFTNRYRFALSLLLGVTFLVATTRQSIAAEAAPSKFLRFVKDDNGGGTLQASVVRYVNKDGVTVDLVAAVHIAEPSFYHALDDSFADYDAVLYELVAPKEMLKPAGDGSGLRKMRRFDKPAAEEQPAEEREESGKGGGALSWVGALQHFLRDTLKLSFQLEEIDYRRSNFIHADMDVETFTRLQEERGESFMTMMLNSMLHEMMNPPEGEAQMGLGDLLFAMQSPDRPRQLKLLFGRQFGRIDEQMAGMEGPNGSVLLTERNKAAMKALRQAIASGKKNMAIFYGAAHFKGMEKIMTEQMGFHQVGPPFWRIAWDMTAPPAPARQPNSPSTSTRH